MTGERFPIKLKRHSGTCPSVLRDEAGIPFARVSRDSRYGYYAMKNKKNWKGHNNDHCLSSYYKGIYRQNYTL